MHVLHNFALNEPAMVVRLMFVHEHEKKFDWFLT